MTNIRSDFPWFKNNPSLTYLDSAATSLKPQIVIDSIMRYLTYETYNSHNTESEVTYNVSLIFKSLKDRLAKFLGCSFENIIITNGATYSINQIVYGIRKYLKKNDEILLNTLEHASNLLPWIELANNNGYNIKYVDISNKMFLSIDDILKSITNKTRVVSFANTTNLIGYTIDANKIATEIKKNYPNIIVVVDATQFLSSEKINLENSAIDFLVCSAHKMFGPTGIGAIYTSNKYHLDPLILGGGMNNDIQKKSFTYTNDNSKYEGGTPNLIGIYGWEAALKYCEKIDYKKEKDRLIELKLYAENEISKINGFIIINKSIKSHILIFKHEKTFSQDIGFFLGKKGIIVRSGFSCAKLIKENINVSDVVRVSLAFYNNKSDIDKLINALKEYKIGDELYGLI